MTPDVDRSGWRRPLAMLTAVAMLVAAFALYHWWNHGSGEAVYGHFEGDVVTKWITPDREMELVEDFYYVDPHDKRWKAGTGSIINGAFIPRMFWSVIGGPFEGNFRSAAVMHDAACGDQTETWEAAHRMFYDACRCAGVGEGKAQTMYWAVFQFGPRWKIGDAKTATETPPQPDPAIVAKAERYFAKKSFTPAEIEACTVAQVEAEVARWDAAARDTNGQ